MPTVAESLGQASQIENVLKAGLEQLDLDQVVTFTLYQRTVLPLDGFVFWVRADILAPSAVANGFTANAASVNESVSVAKPAPVLKVKGSLHYATNVRQEEASTMAVRQVIFTAEEKVNDLAAIAPSQIYIGSFKGVRFAFSQRQNFYHQADLFHYIGDAIYPDMESQIIDDPAAFDSLSLVVSNSLPVWLAIAELAPKPWQPPRELFPMFPSFLVPANIAPPYGVVHIEGDETDALNNAVYMSDLSSASQIAVDTVRITLYGLRSNAALDFRDAVVSFSTTVRPDLIGIMNVPIPRDEKETQREFNMIAMKKTIVFQVSYYQRRINDFAQKLILDAVPSIAFGNTP